MSAQIRLKGLNVNLEHVWQWLGYSASVRAPIQLRNVFQRTVKFGKTLIEPAACYDIFPIEAITPSSIKLRGISLEGKELAANCQGAEEVAIFIVTIGSQLDEQVKQLFHTEPTVALILDSYGSEAVVGVADRVAARIKKYASSRGWGVGEKLCPGCGDWALNEQKKLFSLLDGRQIGVKLDGHLMMYPHKSHSGVIPLGPRVTKQR